MHVQPIRVDLSHGRVVTVHPKTGLDLAGCDRLYPKEYEFLGRLLGLCRDYSDHFAREAAGPEAGDKEEPS
jgi:hypothetical protein